MIIFLVIMCSCVLFLVGVCVGLMYGFGVGIEYYERFQLWECRCERKSCDFFGTYDQVMRGSCEGGKIVKKQMPCMDVRDVSGLDKI